MAIILAIVPELRNFLLGLISGVWTFLVSDQSYPLPGWVLLLIGLFALLGLGIILMIILGALIFPNKQVQQCEDIVHSVKWCWKQDGKEIWDLRCFCPECDLELSPIQYGYERMASFRCRNCSFRLAVAEVGDIELVVKREIERRARKKGDM